METEHTPLKSSRENSPNHGESLPQETLDLNKDSSFTNTTPNICSYKTQTNKPENIEGREANCKAEEASSKKTDFEKIEEEQDTDKISAVKHKVKLFDQIVESVGYGREQWVIIFISGLNFMMQGTYFFLNSAMFIPIQSYFKVDNTQMSIASSMVYTAGIGTSLVLGYLSNQIGRLNLVYITTFIILLSHLVICLVNNFVVYCLCLFVIGGMLNLNGPILTNILAEFLPVRYRAFTMGTIWGWYSLGNIFILVLYLQYMPKYNEEKVSHLLWMFLALPVFTYIMTLLFLKNSARAMIYAEDEKKGLVLLGKMWANTEDYKEKKKVQEESLNNSNNNTHQDQTLDPELNIEANQSNISQEKTDTSSHADVFTDLEQQQLIHELKDYKLHKEPELVDQSSGLKDLFTDNLRRLSVLLCVGWVMNSLIGYGPYFVMPLTLSSLSKQGVKEAIDSPTESEADIIRSQMWVAFIGLLANPIGGLMCEMKSLGRTNTASISALLVSVTCLILLLDFNHLVVYLSVLNIMNTLSFNTTITYTSEAYPTHVRDFSSGFFNSIGNAGAMVSQPLFILLNHIGMKVPYLSTMLLGFVSLISFYLLPFETRGMELDYE